MITWGLKYFRFFFSALVACFLIMKGVHAEGLRSLKVSTSLSAVGVGIQRSPYSLIGDRERSEKVEFFRGVTVNADDSLVFVKNKFNLDSAEGPKEHIESMIKWVYGGLKFSLQENLSLIYTPSRLSGQAMRGDKQGIYLLSDRGGYANWFFGVETNAYETSADSRRTTSSAQFGLMMSLD